MLFSPVTDGDPGRSACRVAKHANGEPQIKAATPERLPHCITRSSVDGRIVFNFIPLADAVLVERTRFVGKAGVFVQSMLFRDDASFVRWCEADRLQFTYPLLFELLRISAPALFVDGA